MWSSPSPGRRACPRLLGRLPTLVSTARSASEEASLGPGTRADRHRHPPSLHHEGATPTTRSTWERRDARITNFRDGSVAFEQLDVEFPVGWSLNATNIVAQKYFRGHARHRPSGSRSLQAGHRPGGRHHHRRGAPRAATSSTTREAEAFSAELKHLIVTPEGGLQLAGVVQHRRARACPQQASACFILAVDDTMDSILNWYVEEGTIFKGGSGAGINLSQASAPRSSCLKGGGTASGPVSFMRGADASAGTIKSRRQDPPRRQDGHPQRRPPRHRGVHLVQGHARSEGPGPARRRLRHGPRRHATATRSSTRTPTTRCGSPTSSCRPCVDDADWHLRAVTTGEVIKTVRARDLMRQIAQATWECADPGMQFDTTINRWHTAANTGRINGSNPCSRVHAPRQLGVQPGQPQPAEVPRRRRRRSTSRASRPPSRSCSPRQEILVGNADYPTEPIGETSPRVPPARHRLRQPRRPAHGPRPAVRLRRGPGLGRRHHRAHDRPRLRHLGPHRGPHGPVRRLRRERGAHAPRARHAPRRGRRRSTRSSCPPSCSSPPSRRGTTPCELGRASSACATRRPRCWRPPAPSA